MNKVELIGRLTVNPELKYTESGKAYTRFTLAVNRKFKKNSNINKTNPFCLSTNSTIHRMNY